MLAHYTQTVQVDTKFHSPFGLVACVVKHWLLNLSHGVPSFYKNNIKICFSLNDKNAYKYFDYETWKNTWEMIGFMSSNTRVISLSDIIGLMYWHWKMLLPWEKGSFILHYILWCHFLSRLYLICFVAMSQNIIYCDAQWDRNEFLVPWQNNTFLF